MKDQNRELVRQRHRGLRLAEQHKEYGDVQATLLAMAGAFELAAAQPLRSESGFVELQRVAIKWYESEQRS